MVWSVALLLSVVAAAFAVWGVRHLAEWLAVSRPAPARLLVVEDWLPRYVLKQAVDEFNRGDYEKMILVGTDHARIDPLDPPCLYSTPETLESLQIRGGLLSIQHVVRGVVETDRTFQSAQAVGSFVRSVSRERSSLNVVTIGPHARRTWLLYVAALGNDASVSVISVPDRRFSVDAWWRSSEGVRSVVGEMIAYLYVRLAFLPWH